MISVTLAFLGGIMKETKIIIRKADQYKNVTFTAIAAFGSLLAIIGAILLLLK